MKHYICFYKIVVKDSIGSSVMFSLFKEEAHAFSGYIKEDSKPCEH